ncbi:hypothetical protein GGQ02_001381 [Salinibacter ruber]|nr:hypothetical protein [Salinibacter ruber]
MRFSTQLPLLLLFSVSFLFGCSASNKATISYDSEEDQTTIETRSYKVSTISGSNYGSQSTIDVRAVARCQGQGCTPGKAKLIFIAPTDRELSFSGIGGEIVADGSQVTRWTTQEAGGTGIDTGSLAGGETGITAYGEFAAITLQTNQLNQIAQASDVKGTLGGKPLRFGGGIKEGLKKLVQKM